MANGLDVETAILDHLIKRRFRLAPKDQILDQGFHVDCVVLGPPPVEGTHFFPTPIALQITTRRGDRGKRAEFVLNAQGVAERLCYLELDRGQEVLADCLQAIEAALLTLFFNRDAPKIALVTVGNNWYTLADLEAELAQYRQWLDRVIDGDLPGHLVYWDVNGFGFISAEVAVGPRGVPEVVTFYVSQAQIDPALRERIAQLKVGACITLAGNERIAVVFEDGGHPPAAQEHGRKTAVHVRRAESRERADTPS